MGRPPVDAPAVVMIDLCGEAHRLARRVIDDDGRQTRDETDLLDALERLTRQAEAVNENELDAAALLRRGELTPRRTRRARETGRDPLAVLAGLADEALEQAS